MLGRALGLLGKLELAAETMRQILKTEPDSADARRALGMIERALAEAPSSQEPETTAVAQPARPWWKFWN
jgi:hypothetical protein